MHREIKFVLGAAALAAAACPQAADAAPKPKAKTGYSNVFTVEKPGDYDFTFTYRNVTTNLHDNLEIVLVKTNDGERVAFRLVDYESIYPASPSEPFAFVNEVKPKTRVERFSIETPGDYRVQVGGCFGVRVPQGGWWGMRSPAPVVEQADWKFVKPAPAAPAGLVSGAVPRSAKLYSALPARDRLQLAYHACYGYFDDLVPMIDCGAIFNYTGCDAENGYNRYDLMTGGGPAFDRVAKEFAPKLDDKDEGKSGDSNGKLNKGFSYSFKKYGEACYKTCAESVKKIVASPANDRILNWFSAWEHCGSYDYGPTSVEAFRKEYLPAKYGTVAKLNQRWHTEYRSFDEVVPATYKMCMGKTKLTNMLELCRARASFLDFRDHNSKAYAKWLGLKTKAIFDNDPMKRPMYSQYSNNNLGSIRWLEWRPLSFEDSLQYTIKPSPTMGFDIYGTDDLVAESFEHYASFSDYRCVPMIKEGNTHALGTENAVRTFWNCFAEGMLGWSSFCFQESPKPELRKFGMCDPDDDMAPRPKLAGVSDMYRALCQVEPFLAYAKRQTLGKPPAIYYSQSCNIMQERGYGSMFDCAPDSHNRVFELIRQCGYPCRIITDRQIQENGKTHLLDQVSAVFFCDAQFIPEETLDVLEKWVEKGGHVVADGQTGAFDGHGFPTTRFVDFLGIKPVVRKRVSEDVAKNLEFGYSDYAFEAVNKDELWLTMQEYLHQRLATHPIAKKIGKIMFSGFGSQDVRSVAGENIILGNSGQVAWNVRNVGKGTAQYFAGYLGTIYGAGCTQFEWRDSHADYAPRQLFGALLDYFGATKNAETTIEDSWRVRCGSPLVDKFGNQFNSITSFASHRIPAFTAKFPLAANAKAPKAVYLTRDRTRRVEQLDFTYDGKTRVVTVKAPGMQTYANFLFVNEQPLPLLSTEFADGARGSWDIPDYRPGDVMTVKARLFNTTGRDLVKGRIKVRLTDGWLCDRTEVEVGAVKAWGVSEEVTFKVGAPTVCCARRLRPVSFVYESGDVVSTPSTTQVWFQKEPLVTGVVP